MFTTKQDTQWWSLRLKYTKTLLKNRKYYSKGLADIAMLNYANIITCAFSHLFNQRIGRKAI